MKSPNTYTSRQIAAITGVSVNTVYNRLLRLSLSPEYTRYNINYYSENTFNLVVKSLDVTRKEKTFIKYYPIKTTETFYIYESKMNNN